MDPIKGMFLQYLEEFCMDQSTAQLPLSRGWLLPPSYKLLLLLASLCAGVRLSEQS